MGHVTSWEKPSGLPAGLTTPSAAYAWRHCVLIAGAMCALLVAASVCAAYSPYPWIAVLLLPLLGAQIYKITIIMHDCCHGTMFRGRRWNAVVGTIGGYFVATEFGSFRRVHLKHHREYGEPDDPQGDDYLGLEAASRTALAWHLGRPLLGYNLFKLAMFDRASAAREDRQPSTPGWPRRLSFLAGVAGVQILIAAMASGLFAVWWTVLLYPAAAATFALFFSQTRGFAEHIAAPGYSPVRHARTHLPHWFDRLFLYTLNFNYHVEHHRHPGVPSCHLPRLHTAMRGEIPDADVSPSMVATVLRRWRAAPGGQ